MQFYLTVICNDSRRHGRTMSRLLLIAVRSLRRPRTSDVLCHLISSAYYKSDLESFRLNTVWFVHQRKLPSGASRLSVIFTFFHCILWVVSPWILWYINTDVQVVAVSFKYKYFKATLLCEVATTNPHVTAHAGAAIKVLQHRGAVITDSLNPPPPVSSFYFNIPLERGCKDTLTIFSRAGRSTGSERTCEIVYHSTVPVYI